MKKFIYTLFIISASAFLFGFQLLYNSGEVGSTGSPGEGTCSGCHGGGAAGTTISVTAVPAFTNNMYDPGNNYTITVTVSNSSQGAFGFGCEILNSQNANAGTMTNAGSGATFANAFNGRKNVLHTTRKLGTGNASWTFVWTPPLSGDVTFYIAGNAVNSNNSTTGDSPSNTSFTLSNSLGTGIVNSNLQEKIQLSVYPNPASEYIKVNWVLKEKSQLKTELTDINGKVVKTFQDEEQETGSVSKTYSLNGIPSGIYFIKVSVDEKKISQKLICIQ